LKAGYDVIIIPSPGIKNKDFWAIKNNMEILFIRAGLIVEKT